MIVKNIKADEEREEDIAIPPPAPTR